MDCTRESMFVAASVTPFTGLFDRTADALNCLCHLHHCRQYILRLARILCHRVVDVGRIIIVLLTTLHKCTVIRQDVLVDITNNLLRRNNQSLYSPQLPAH